MYVHTYTNQDTVVPPLPDMRCWCGASPKIADFAVAARARCGLFLYIAPNFSSVEGCRKKVSFTQIDEMWPAYFRKKYDYE